ncbi:zeta toxin family protein [Mucilaginibacter flavidus]|uniref:zeta toxin family protein n=1 Tax=Mucilaginibacter flavidus TaxID=2949309 RepID=UPI002092A85D|nr:zeta toxin family protein [Mucilaginibacter flavidus]MCO5950072.1 zeta toxin family protein [Mucilaginibacter flavidus]
MPNLYIIAGCDGAGKTTVANILLSEVLNCTDFVNPSNILAGLSASTPERVAIKAGRIALNTIELLLQRGVDFAIETTLAGKCYVGLIKKAQSNGYKVSFIFLWLNTPQLAIQRVAGAGGRPLSDEIITRRFTRGRYNLHSLYIPICDFYTIITNDMGKPEQVKTREAGQVTKAVDSSGLLVNTKTKLTPENVLLRDKILKGVTEAYKKLLTTSIENNRKLVIADEDSNIQHLPAIELQKRLSEN